MQRSNQFSKIKSNCFYECCHLTLSWRRPISYRNQSIEFSLIIYLYNILTPILEKLTMNTFIWIPENIYLFKVNNKNTTERHEIFLKLTIQTPERRCLHRSDIFIVNLQHISYLFLMSLFLTLRRYLFVAIFWSVTSRIQFNGTSLL